VKCLLSSGADINLCDEGGKSPLFVATSAGYYDIVRLLRAHGALRKENMKAHYKTISKGTNDNETLADGNSLLNTCEYPEEEISHSTEKREEEKSAIYLYQKYKKGRKKQCIQENRKEKKK
jgi:ankyrin repeat protein